MAVDEAVLESVGKGESLPTLRLYAWHPPCLSLGYAQPHADIDQKGLVSRGWDLVRRPTGGRAILHTDELTYSVIAPHREPRIAGGVLESYRRLSQALLTALTELGLPAKVNSVGISEGSQEEPVCFEVPSNYEITYKGKKLIGSAQARKKAGVLQHGTLPLHGDLTRITQVLIFPNQRDRSLARQRLLARASTVETVLGYRLSWENAAQAFAAAFHHTLNLTLIPDQLSESETKRTSELMRDKYANPEWTNRV
jgi:lipoate-protein ligase A